MESTARGGTRWRRFAVVMVPSAAATAAIGVALSQGALAASFSVSGQSFKVSTPELVGKGFVQYGGVDTGVDLDGKTQNHPVAISAFKSATIKNLCQSVRTPVPGLGAVYLRLEAGGKGTPVAADNLYIDVAQLEADAEFRNIDIGVAAGSSTKGPGVKPDEVSNKRVNPNGFAQQADEAVLKKVEQTAWATSAGTFKLSGLSMKLGTDPKMECF
ncbi:DUF6230 family protein [Streptomyces sp. NPDC060194]|uniref:DUF6230 family protein n=1 Tax=Streptomyces sp. NPDC060194 TaxID=3347069 RepID=UPI0036516E60